ncbi:hypothetical protein FOZ61_004175 [Perkinsus olseni]|uniref:Uncharacterized protein n=1 Tax=Perkinsus olseni TaxID=32597 RepID=A0A7J6MCT2_PEROL|nr:hypothetical protein FOZ61_004175 [Perkinsus olseni]
MYWMKASTPQVPMRLLQDLHHELPHGASDNAENTVVLEKAVVAHFGHRVHSGGSQESPDLRRNAAVSYTAKRLLLVKQTSFSRL